MTPRSDRAEIGVIGGSGLYNLTTLGNPRQVHLDTPYGQPSDAITVGELAGRVVAFLPRHGRGHRLPPAGIPAAANIYALRTLGVREIISVSAVGSLRADLRPGDLVVPDQIVDLTRGGRQSSFFDADLVVHVPFAEPYCGRIRRTLIAAARGATDCDVHDGGTYVCIAGPQFSTRAESELYRSWGLDLVGMTAVPEAKLAREAELCYAGLALVTDYDCWRTDEKAVTAAMVAEVMRKNTAAAQLAISQFLKAAELPQSCDCHEALSDSIISDRSAVPSAVREKFDLLIGRHLSR